MEIIRPSGDRRCSSSEQILDNDDDDNEDVNNVTGDDKDASVNTDEPPRYPSPDIESRDQVPVPDVTVARDNADAPAVKPCGVPAPSITSLVGITSFCITNEMK